MNSTTTSSTKRKAPQEHELSPEHVSPSKTPKVTDPTMPVLSKVSNTGGKESNLPSGSTPQDIDNMSAELYFAKFKQFLVQNELFVVLKQKAKEIHNVPRVSNIPEQSHTASNETRRILFDSSFDSNSARELTEPLEDGQLHDSPPRAPVTCSDEIELECNVPLDKDSEKLGPEVSQRIVDMIMNFLARNRKAENIENLVSSFPRPSNLPCMQSPKLNKSVYLKISGHAQKFDVKCRKLQDILNAASSALVGAFQS